MQTYSRSVDLPVPVFSVTYTCFVWSRSLSSTGFPVVLLLTVPRMIPIPCPSYQSDVVASPDDWQSLQTNSLPVCQYISITNPLPLSRDVSSDKAEKRHHAPDLGPIRSNGNETKLSTLCGEHKVVVDLIPEKATMRAGTSEA